MVNSDYVFYALQIQGGANCVEIGELLQYYMLNTVINVLFKNFIALWRHLAKTQLLCDAQIYLYNVNKRQ